MSTEMLNNSERVGDACSITYAMKKDLEAQLTVLLSEITSLLLQDGHDNEVTHWDEIQELITDWQDVGLHAMKIQLLHQVLSSIPASDKLSDWDNVLSKLVVD